jgi:hypothetical protein
MFEHLNATNREKPEKKRFYALALDEAPMNQNYGLIGRLLVYAPTRAHAMEQRRRWKKDFPAVKTRVLELNRGDLPIRTWLDPRLHLAAANSQYLH